MISSRTKNTSRNIIYAVIFQVIKLLLTFASRVIFVKKLGAEYLGINGLFSNVLTILSLTDLGMTTTMMYCLYKPLAENDEVKISSYTNYFKKTYNIIALVVAFVGIILIPVLKYIVNLPNEMEHIYLYYILLLLNSVISYLFVYKTTLLQADQKMYIINKYDTIFQFVLFVMQITILLITENFALYLLCNVICTLLSNMLKAKKADELYPYLNKNKENKLKSNEKKELYQNLFSMFFYKLGGVIQSNTDNILISIFAGTIFVGYYSNYTQIILQVTTFLTIIFTSLKASIGNFVTEKDKKSQYKMFEILETYNFWLVGASSLLFLTLIPDFIKICFGQEYILGELFLVFIVLNFYTSNIRQTMWVYRETTGVFVKTKYITIITSVINLILSIILGKIFGLIGVVIATVISRMIYAWWKEPIIIYNECFEKSSKDYFANYIFRIILIAVMYLILREIFECIIIDSLILMLFTKAMITLIFILIVFGIIYRKNKAIDFLKDKVKPYFKKQLNG